MDGLEYEDVSELRMDNVGFVGRVIRDSPCSNHGFKDPLGSLCSNLGHTAEEMRKRDVQQPLALQKM